MNDIQLNMLTAFLVALGQQKESLPDEVLTELRALSVNLRVAQLKVIASNYPPLFAPYEEAFNYLNNQAHQRKQSLKFIPDDSQAKKATNTTDVGNNSSVIKDLPDMEKTLADMEKTLAKINEIAPTKPRLLEIFSSVIADDNPVVAMQNYFTF